MRTSHNGSETEAKWQYRVNCAQESLPSAIVKPFAEAGGVSRSRLHVVPRRGDCSILACRVIVLDARYLISSGIWIHRSKGETVCCTPKPTHSLNTRLHDNKKQISLVCASCARFAASFHGLLHLHLPCPRWSMYSNATDIRLSVRRCIGSCSGCLCRCPLSPIRSQAQFAPEAVTYYIGGSAP